MVAEHDVEAGVGQGDGLGTDLDQGYVDARLGEQPPSMGKLAFGEVEADRPGAGSGQGGPVSPLVPAEVRVRLRDLQRVASR